MVLEMQILGPYSRSTESEIARQFIFTSPSGDSATCVSEAQRQKQSISKFIVHTNNLAIILKCRF